MALAHYLADRRISAMERIYWLFNLTSQAPPVSHDKLLCTLQRLLDTLPPAQTAAATELTHFGRDALLTLKRRQECGGTATATDTALSLSLWAATHRYRAELLGDEDVQARVAQAHPKHWRFNDVRNLIILDLDNRLSVRLWLDLSVPRRLDIHKPSHVHTLSYDEEMRTFTNTDDSCVSWRELVVHGCNHVYRTDSVASVVKETMAVQWGRPVQAETEGETGSLF